MCFSFIVICQKWKLYLQQYCFSAGSRLTSLETFLPCHKGLLTRVIVETQLHFYDFKKDAERIFILYGPQVSSFHLTADCLFSSHHNSRDLAIIFFWSRCCSNTTYKQTRLLLLGNICRHLFLFSKIIVLSNNQISSSC